MNARSSIKNKLTYFQSLIYAKSPSIIDFAKAFDSVPHNELLYKLWLTGITGPLWLFFKDYLQNRKHFVEVEGCKSDLLPVQSGLSQGSVLGPLLFLIYVNDTPSLCSFLSVFLFADDAKLIT